MPPREWAERAYDVVRWTEFPRGGHFAAMEEPELLAEDIRAFFRPLRGRLDRGRPRAAASSSRARTGARARRGRCRRARPSAGAAQPPELLEREEPADDEPRGVRRARSGRCAGRAATPGRCRRRPASRTPAVILPQRIGSKGKRRAMPLLLGGRQQRQHRLEHPEAVERRRAPRREADTPAGPGAPGRGLARLPPGRVRRTTGNEPIGSPAAMALARRRADSAKRYSASGNGGAAPPGGPAPRRRPRAGGRGGPGTRRRRAAAPRRSSSRARARRTRPPSRLCTSPGRRPARGASRIESRRFGGPLAAGRRCSAPRAASLSAS